MKLNYVLLGLIKLHPSVSGYELKTIIKESTGYFVSAALSQIYPALKILTEKGMVVYQVEPLVGKQDRKVYTITEKGNEELITWLKEPPDFIASAEGFRDFLLRLTFMGDLDNATIIEYLSAGLDFYKAEKLRIVDDNLANEKSYLSWESKDKTRYYYLWEQEYQWIVDDVCRKIIWIEQLIKDLSSGTVGDELSQ